MRRVALIYRSGQETRRVSFIAPAEKAPYSAAELEALAINQALRRGVITQDEKALCRAEVLPPG